MTNKLGLIGALALGVISLSSSAYAVDITWCLQGTGCKLQTGVAQSTKTYSSTDGAYDINASGFTSFKSSTYTSTNLYQALPGLGVNSKQTVNNEPTMNQASLDWNVFGLSEYMMLDMTTLGADYDLFTNFQLNFVVNSTPGLAQNPTVRIYSANSSNFDTALSLPTLGEITATSEKFGIDLDISKHPKYLFISVDPDKEQLKTLQSLGYGVFLNSIVGTLPELTRDPIITPDDTLCDTCDTSGQGFDPIPDPEPSSLALIALGIAGLYAMRRKSN